MKYNEIHTELEKWKEEGIISETQYNTLDERYKPKKFYIPRIHKQFPIEKMLWFFGGAIVVLGSLSWVGQTVSAVNNFVVFASLAMIAAAMLFVGDYVAGRPTRVLRYTGKGVLLVASLLITFILFYADIKYKLFGNWALFMLLGCLILVPIAYKMREKVVLGYSLILFLIWFISQGKISSGEYIGTWLGIEFPTRMVIFALIFIGIGYIHKHKVFEGFDPSKKFDNLAKTYYIFGLSTLFISSYKASVGQWLVHPLFSMKFESLLFVLLTLGLAIYAIYFGLVKENRIFLNFGIVFFIIEVLGKVNEAIGTRVQGPVYYGIMIVVIGTLAGILEYMITHKEQIKKELIQGK